MLVMLVASIACEVNQERERVCAYPDVAIVCPSPPLGGTDSIGGGLGWRSRGYTCSAGAAHY